MSTNRIWIWFAENGNIRKWQREPFPEGMEFVAVSAPANPAQGVSEAVEKLAQEIALDTVSAEDRDEYDWAKTDEIWKASFRRRAERYLTAIGAGGQAVVEPALCQYEFDDGTISHYAGCFGEIHEVNGKKVVRRTPLYLHPAPSGQAVAGEELRRYIDKCKELAANGEYAWWSRLAEILSALSNPPAQPGWRDLTGHVEIAHDGFAGDIIGHYETREGKRGVVVQQDGTRVVHVYGEKWLEVDRG